MAVRGGWRPLSGLICEIVNSVGQGNFTFVREKSGKSQGISNTYGCGNHDSGSASEVLIGKSKVSFLFCGSTWSPFSQSIPVSFTE